MSEVHLGSLIRYRTERRRENTRLRKRVERLEEFMLASSTDHNLKRLERRVDHLEDRINFRDTNNQLPRYKHINCRCVPIHVCEKDCKIHPIKEVIGPATTHGTFHSPSETWQCRRIR